MKVYLITSTGSLVVSPLSPDDYRRSWVYDLAYHGRTTSSVVNPYRKKPYLIQTFARHEILCGDIVRPGDSASLLVTDTIARRLAAFPDVDIVPSEWNAVMRFNVDREGLAKIERDVGVFDEDAYLRWLDRITRRVSPRFFPTQHCQVICAPVSRMTIAEGEPFFSVSLPDRVGFEREHDLRLAHRIWDSFSMISRYGTYIVREDLYRVIEDHLGDDSAFVRSCVTI